MIVVHHLEDSRSHRILWLLEELNIEYEVRRYERDRRTFLAPPALKEVHALGKAPIMEIGGHTLIETGANIDYFVDRAAVPLRPTGGIGEILYRQFVHYSEGSLMGPLLVLLVLKRLGILGLPARGIIQRMIHQHLEWLELELADRPWFTGEQFSAADIMMSFPLEVARARAGLDSGFPNLQEWLARVQARPAYRAALERGGKYAYCADSRI